MNNNTKRSTIYKTSIIFISILVNSNVCFSQVVTSDSLVVMSQIIQLTDNLLIDMDQKVATIAVLPFETTKGRSTARGLGEAAAILLNQTLLNDKNIVVVERQRLQEVVEEIGLSQTGLTHEEIEVGRLLNVRYMIAGAVADLGSRFLLAARLVEVETGNILRSASIELPASNFLSVSSGLVAIKRYPITAAFRSMILPGWGQFYNEKPTKGSIILGSELVLATATITSFLLYKQSRDAYDRANQRGIATEKYNEMEKYARVNWVSMGLMSTVWFYAIIDSYIDSRNQIKQYQKNGK